MSSDRVVLVRGTRFQVSERYTVRAPLGHGTYGVIAAATDACDGSTVAIKKVSNAFEDAIDCRKVLREMSLLRHFEGHENILSLRDIMIHGKPATDLYLVMEAMDTDLHQIIHSGQPLSNDHVQWFTYQLVRGLKALHSARVLHRDLKPANLLVNKNCDLKICDFGLARGLVTDEGEPGSPGSPNMTEYVVTRWYRAPELLVCAETYDGAIDLFSAGCILAELLGRAPLFPGRDHLQQLRLVLRTLGTPADAELERLSTIGDPAAWRYIRTLPRSAGHRMSTLFPNAPSHATELLQRLLALDPARRPTAADALRHPYFDDLHAINIEPDAPSFAFPPGVERHDVSAAVLCELIAEEHRRYHPHAPAPVWASALRPASAPAAAAEPAGGMLTRAIKRRLCPPAK